MRNTNQTSRLRLLTISGLLLTLTACGTSPDVGLVVKAPCPAPPELPPSLQATPPQPTASDSVKPFLLKVQGYFQTWQADQTPPR